MSNEKIKSENYQEFGGINSKASPYVTGPMEFLDLKNLDFQTPGALTPRWGSTMYCGQTFTQAPLLISEYAKLNGTSFVIIGTTAGLWYGATTGQNQGMSFTWFDTTFNYGGADAVDDKNLVYASSSGLGTKFITCNPNGTSFLAFPQLPLLNGDPALQFGNGTNGALSVKNTTLLPSGHPTDTAVFGDWLFGADGNKFWKFNGTTTIMAQLTPPFGHGSGVTSSAYNSFSQGLTLSLGIGLSGYVAFYASYTNSRGVEGPIWPIAVIDGGSLNGATAAAINNATLLAPSWYFWPPIEYGISAVSIYSYYSDNYIDIQTADIWSLPYVFLAKFPIGYQLGTLTNVGGTFTRVGLGTTFGGLSMLTSNSFPAPSNPQYIAMGISYIPYQTGTASGLSLVSFGSYSPQYLEVYQNRMFLAGFSSTPSTVWFSDTGEPEGYFDDSNFEVRTNDGDAITCMKAYSTRLYIFKRKSFHVLTGDNPNNFFLSELSDQYGCVNNNCAVVYEQNLIFLDQKGVYLWNGGSIQHLSLKIQPIFDRMNYSVAQNTACMAHDKLRNQIVVAIPVDSSSTNNLYVVYDYASGAWTTYTSGFTPSALAAIQGRNNTKNLFVGDATNKSVNWFGPSFITDSGVGITTYWKTRYLHDMGDTTQKMFRRLYLNTDSPASSTLVFNVNFYQDYGSSVVLSASFALSQFQNRYDFGVSAKSLAFEMYNIQTSSAFKIYGFTIESRFMRRV